MSAGWSTNLATDPLEKRLCAVPPCAGSRRESRSAAFDVPARPPVDDLVRWSPERCDCRPRSLYRIGGWWMSERREELSFDDFEDAYSEYSPRKRRKTDLSPPDKRRAPYSVQAPNKRPRNPIGGTGVERGDFRRVSAVVSSNGEQLVADETNANGFWRLSVEEKRADRLLDIAAQRLPGISLSDDGLGQTFGNETAVHLLGHLEHDIGIHTKSLPSRRPTC